MTDLIKIDYDWYSEKYELNDFQGFYVVQENFTHMSFKSSLNDGLT